MPDPDRIRDAQEAIAAAQLKPTKTIDAIDPPGCGCTECITGLYRPIDQASDEELIAMILGEIPNHSGYDVAEFMVRDDGMVVTPIWRY
jgi:hypothetical protein